MDRRRKMKVGKKEDEKMGRWEGGKRWKLRRWEGIKNGRTAQGARRTVRMEGGKVEKNGMKKGKGFYFWDTDLTDLQG